MARIPTEISGPRDFVDPVDDFLGVGWAYPVAVSRDRSVATSRHDEDVRQAIRIILGTNPGERVMRPGYGAGLRDFVFAPIRPATMALIKKRVEDALVDEEPRIDVIAVEVAPDPPGSSRVMIDVSYRVRATNTAANLVYPFYLREGSSS